MTTYRWTCQACDHVNSPKVSNCEKCNCPAKVSGFEIEKFKQIRQLGSAVEIREFFTVSTYKLVLMSFCTFSIYVIYWFYKNWKLIKVQTPNSKVMPFLRAFFSPIFAYSCFKKIKESGTQIETIKNLPIGCLAAIFFLINLVSRLPDPYSLLGTLTFLPLISVNSAALAVNFKHNQNFQNNLNFSVLNKVAIGVGGLLWLMVIIGMMAHKNA